MKFLNVSDIATMLGAPFVGNDFLVNGACSVDSPENHKVSYINDLSRIEKLDFGASETLFLVRNLPRVRGTCSFIEVPNPRFAYAKVSALLTDQIKRGGPHELSFVAASVEIAKNTAVGPFSVIHEGAIIGENVVIENNVTINGCVVIGNNTRIKSNSVIGTDGFGFEFSGAGVPTRIYHLGGVKIGDNVEIGCNSVVCRGTISDTVIANDVKIDDQVFIAHNVKIGERSMVVACTEISGSVTIGSDCWISPQTSIINQVSVGNGAFVGIGAVIIRNVESGSVVVGNPAKPLRKS